VGLSDERGDGIGVADDPQAAPVIAEHERDRAVTEIADLDAIDHLDMERAASAAMVAPPSVRLYNR
jgi:hypothetical protein